MRNSRDWHRNKRRRWYKRRPRSRRLPSEAGVVVVEEVEMTMLCSTRSNQQRQRRRQINKRTTNPRGTLTPSLLSLRKLPSQILKFKTLTLSRVFRTRTWKRSGPTKRSMKMRSQWETRWTWTMMKLQLSMMSSNKTTKVKVKTLCGKRDSRNFRPSTSMMMYLILKSQRRFNRNRSRTIRSLKIKVPCGLLSSKFHWKKKA